MNLVILNGLISLEKEMDGVINIVEEDGIYVMMIYLDTNSYMYFLAYIIKNFINLFMFKNIDI